MIHCPTCQRRRPASLMRLNGDRLVCGFCDEREYHVGTYAPPPEPPLSAGVTAAWLMALVAFLVLGVLYLMGVI